MNKTVSMLVALLILTILLTGCAAATATPAANQPSAYPINEAPNTPAEGAYPITQPEYIPFDTPNPYPDNAATASPDAFRLQKPIYASDTQVRGTGPAGVPIFLMDITKMGLLLGETVIDANGQFVFEVPTGLEAGHRIGILLGGLEGTQWKPEDFYPRHYYGDEARQVPQIGFFHDTALVKEKP